MTAARASRSEQRPGFLAVEEADGSAPFAACRAARLRWSTTAGHAPYGAAGWRESTSGSNPSGSPEGGAHARALDPSRRPLSTPGGAGHWRPGVRPVRVSSVLPSLPGGGAGALLPSGPSSARAAPCGGREEDEPGWAAENAASLLPWFPGHARHLACSTLTVKRSNAALVARGEDDEAAARDQSGVCL